MKALNLRLLAVKWYFRDLMLKFSLYYAGHIFTFFYYVLLAFKPKKAYQILLSASRHSHSKLASKLIAKKIDNLQPGIDESLATENNLDIKYPIGRSIVLLNPVISNDGVLKGILLIKFTDTFSYYCKNINNIELLKYFNIVLEPSWAGYALPGILYWTRFTSGKILIESSEIKDFKLIQGLNSILTPVSFGSSDWVDHQVFTPLAEDKVYDSIYVANFYYIKRHHVYFKALKKLKGINYKAVLVCGQWGDNREEIESLIDFYGIREMLDIRVGLSQEQLNVVLNQSKVNVLMSIKEGSNRSIFEGLFAGVPGIILRNNIGINKTYINKNTGMQIHENELSDALLHFAANWVNYDTRTWAVNNISPTVTTKKLIEQFSIEGDAHRSHYENVAVKVNIPEARYINQSDSQLFLSSRLVLDIFGHKDENNEYYYNRLTNELKKHP